MLLLRLRLHLRPTQTVVALVIVSGSIHCISITTRMSVLIYLLKCLLVSLSLVSFLFSSILRLVIAAWCLLAMSISCAYLSLLTYTLQVFYLLTSFLHVIQSQLFVFDSNLLVTTPRTCALSLGVMGGVSSVALHYISIGRVSRRPKQWRELGENLRIFSSPQLNHSYRAWSSQSISWSSLYRLRVLIITPLLEEFNH